VSYTTYQTDANVFIHKDSVDLLFLVLKATPAFGYASQTAVDNAAHIEALFREYGWSVRFDEWGNIKSMWAQNEGSPETEERFLQLIAPYMHRGSYIEMRGEDDAWWRWVFKGGKCHEVLPTVTWPTMEDL